MRSTARSGRQRDPDLEVTHEILRRGDPAQQPAAQDTWLRDTRRGVLRAGGQGCERRHVMKCGGCSLGNLNPPPETDRLTGFMEKAVPTWAELQKVFYGKGAIKGCRYLRYATQSLELPQR